MKVSIIIPYYDPQLKKVGMLAELLTSMSHHLSERGTEGELILVTNGPSYVESHNEGLRRATGDYLIILNDDVVIHDDKWIEKLCVPGVLASWRETGGWPDAACFAMSREVFEKLGLMDEIYKDGFNYEDTDYFRTAQSKGIPFYYAGVEMRHIGNVTSQIYMDPSEKRHKVDHNMEIYHKKWRS